MDLIGKVRDQANRHLQIPPHSARQRETPPPNNPHPNNNNNGAIDRAIAIAKGGGPTTGPLPGAEVWSYDPLIVKVAGREYSIGLPPTRQQGAFLDADEREQLCGGAKRGGKSRVICIKLLMLAINFPGNKLRLLRQDLTDLRDSTLATWEQTVPPELILDHHQTHKTYTIRTNGKPSTLHYGGLSDFGPNDMSVQGWEHGAFAIDEPSEVDETNYRMLLSQLCWVLPDGTRPPYMALLGSNPEPGWVLDRFSPIIEPTEEDETLKTVSNGKMIFVKFLPEDNPYLPPNWVEDQSNAPDEWVKKYLKGSWRTSTGQVFKEWDDRVHYIEMPPADYLRSLQLVASIDHASTGITAMVVVGIDPDGNLIALSEYYERNKLISEHVKGMDQLMTRCANLCGKNGVMLNVKEPGVLPSTQAYEYILMDPATQQKTLQRSNELYSVMDEYRRNGIPSVPAHNTLEAGINLVAEYIHIKPAHHHPITGVPGSPSMFVVRGECPNLRKNIIGLRRDITDRGVVRYLGEDHALDNFRYIAMSRPEPPRRTSNDVLKLNSADQIACRTHDAWAAKFGTQGSSNNWWSGMVQ